LTFILNAKENAKPRTEEEGSWPSRAAQDGKAQKR
jgi:hypothetical protein